MITYFIQVSLCWLVLYLMYYLFLKNVTHFRINRYFLLGSMLAGLIIPLLAALVPPNEVVPSVQVYLESIEEVVVTAQPEEPQTITWTKLLWLIYLLGVLVVASRLIYGVWKIVRLYHNNEKFYQGKTIIVHTKEYHMPFSFFNVIFIGKSKLCNDHWEEILEHESCHVHSYHSLDILLTEIIHVFFWFNPIVVLFKAELKACHEYEADRAALKNVNKESYSMLLLGQPASGSELALSNPFFNSLIKNRIKMMYKKQSNNQTLLRYFIAAPILISLLYAFSPAPNDFKSIIIPSETQDTLKNKPFKVVDEMPVFPESEKYSGVMDFVIKNLKYPETAAKNKTEGKVIVSFIIQPDGKMDGISILRSADPELSKESLRVLEQMAAEINWKPGLIKNKPVAVEMTLPLIFKLNTDAKAPLEKKADEEAKKVTEDEIVMPMFPGAKNQEESVSMIFKFITENLVYPKSAADNNVQGMVMVQLVVDKEGNLKESIILRSLNKECDEEVNRIISKLQSMKGKWTPGTKNGNIENVSLTLPIKFKLDEQKTNAVFSVSPNPANTRIVISVSEQVSKNSGFAIIDVKGQVRKSFTAGAGDKVEIDVTGFEKGNYFVRTLVNKEPISIGFVKN